MADSNCNILWKSERVYRCHSFHFNMCRCMCARNDICTRKIWASVCTCFIVSFFYFFFFLLLSFFFSSINSSLAWKYECVNTAHERLLTHTHRHIVHTHTHSLTPNVNVLSSSIILGRTRQYQCKWLVRKFVSIQVCACHAWHAYARVCVYHHQCSPYIKSERKKNIQQRTHTHTLARIPIQWHEHALIHDIANRVI